MWLMSIIQQHGKWVLRLYRKLLTHEPTFTGLVVVSALVSQFSMLLAFFLPLKVIILMGSPEVPSYFPDFIAQHSRSTQVMGLGAAAVVCFLVHQLADFFGQRWAEKGAESMRLKSEKLPLFSNQDDIAKLAYQRLTKNMAAYIFVGMTLVLYAFIYPSFMAVIVAYLLLVFVLFLTLTQQSGWLRALLIDNANSSITFLSGIGFLIAFSFIALDFLLWSTEGIIAAIISLLLSRQLFQRLSASIKESIALDRQRAQINALFFYEQSLMEKQTVSRKLIDVITAEEDLHTFLGLVHQHLADTPLLGQSEEAPCKVERAQWFQTSIPNVIAFHLHLSQGKTSTWRLRVHVFHPKNANLALSESDLLLEQPEIAPGLKMHSIHNHKGHHFHYFLVPELNRLPTKMVAERHSDLLAELWKHKLNPTMNDRYARTHAQLPDRLTKKLPGGMQVAVNSSKQQHILADFMVVADRLHRWLRAQPTCLVNLDMTNADIMFTCASNEAINDYRIAFWGRWAIEPIGSFYSADKPSLERLPSLLAQAQKCNPQLRHVSAEGVALTALLHTLEKQLSKQKFRSALELLPRILAYTEQVGLYVNVDTA